MSIATAITAAQGRVADCYTAISNKGGTLPATQNLANMPTAIGSIPSGSTPTLITKTITQNGTYNASSDNADGYSSVTVNVSGGGGYTEFPPYQIVNGVASKRSGALTGSEFSNITSIGDYGLYYAFNGCSGLTGTLDLSSLTSIGDYGISYAFNGCSGLTSVNLSSLTSVGRFGLSYAFNECSGLISVNLSSLTTVDNYGLEDAFYYCSGLTGVLDLSSLTTINSNGLRSAFDGCSGLISVNLSSLTTVGSYGLAYAFNLCSGLTNVYFNSLTTTSFGSYKNQFQNMLRATGNSKTHTLHFPSNLQSKISSLTGYPNFGGTSGYVTLSFDLPATS